MIYYYLRLPFSKTAINQYFAGIVVFLVALPLSLGIALASGAPLVSGLLGAIVGGLIVGVLSGSSIGITGPSTALAAIVAQQIQQLGSFEAFLLALFFAGVFQILLGICRAGSFAEFFPASVVKGLLAATGILITLKQIPHLLGYDPIPFGDTAFFEIDGTNTFSEIWHSYLHLQMGALVIGVGGLLFLIFWESFPKLKHSLIPAPLFVVLIAVGISFLLHKFNMPWAIESTHLVQVPKLNSFSAIQESLKFADFKKLFSPGIYTAAMMIAVSASLETLLNLEATDKIDPEQRISPPNQELVAQGVGNMILGLMGGIPITSAIVRSSANIQAGGRNRLATISHGFLLLICLVFLPFFLNEIPLSALAAILIVIGTKLARPTLFMQMWKEGLSQFLPFVITILAIIFTNLLLGIFIGLGVGLLFVLHSNLRPPMHQILERHASGDVLRLELGNQVSFLNRPFLMKALDEVPNNSQFLIDARSTDYIDPDILSLLHDYVHSKAKIRSVKVSLLGFKEKYGQFRDRIRFIDYSTRELQSKLTPTQVLEILQEGNQRFYEGRTLVRDYRRQVQKTSTGEYPMAVILSCIDSRAPVEMIFDAGLGDLFSIRIAGNVANEKELASMEFACLIAGVKLVLVLGHASCGAVKAAVDFFQTNKSVEEVTGSKHLNVLLREIQKQIDPKTFLAEKIASEEDYKKYVDALARRNIEGTIETIHKHSPALSKLAQEGKIAIKGAFYDIATGCVEFL